MVAVCRPLLALNLSESLPLGLYVYIPRSVRVGGLVTLCLPERAGRLAQERGYIGRGSCPGKAAPILKRVMAMEGAKIAVGEDGVWVDGQRLPASAYHRFDTAGRPMPEVQGGKLMVKPDEAWVMGSHPDSFDSRYFGPVPVASMSTVAPLWIW